MVYKLSDGLSVPRNNYPKWDKKMCIRDSYNPYQSDPIHIVRILPDEKIFAEMDRRKMCIRDRSRGGKMFYYVTLSYYDKNLSDKQFQKEQDEL